MQFFIYQRVVLDILNEVIITCSEACLAMNQCDSDERRCIRALQYFSVSSSSSTSSQLGTNKNNKQEHTKWALLTDNNKVVTAIRNTMMKSLASSSFDDKITILSEEVRVHSGLLQGVHIVSFYFITQCLFKCLLVFRCFVYSFPLLEICIISDLVMHITFVCATQL
jgi:hypothetical protein